MQAPPHGGARIEAGRIVAWLPAGVLNPGKQFPAGAVILPALGDAHVHLSALGRQSREVKLNGMDHEPTLARLRAAHAALPAGEWLTGMGWDQNLWRLPEGGWPTAAMLEAACPGRPVSLRRVDGHALWASPAALRMAGISAASADPEGGRILRDARGAPAGVLIDNAMGLVTRLLPRRDAAACARDLLAGQARMLAAGALRVHDMDIHDTLAESYRTLAAKDALALDLRVYAGAETKLAAELLRSGPQRISPRLVLRRNQDLCRRRARLARRGAARPLRRRAGGARAAAVGRQGAA
jgi:predicted amidohydrolase YtcJ